MFIYPEVLTPKCINQHCYLMVTVECKRVTGYVIAEVVLLKNIANVYFSAVLTPKCINQQSYLMVTVFRLNRVTGFLIAKVRRLKLIAKVNLPRSTYTQMHKSTK